MPLVQAGPAIQSRGGRHHGPPWTTRKESWHHACVNTRICAPLQTSICRISEIISALTSKTHTCINTFICTYMHSFYTFCDTHVYILSYMSYIHTYSYNAARLVYRYSSDSLPASSVSVLALIAPLYLGSAYFLFIVCLRLSLSLRVPPSHTVFTQANAMNDCPISRWPQDFLGQMFEQRCQTLCGGTGYDTYIAHSAYIHAYGTDRWLQESIAYLYVIIDAYTHTDRSTIPEGRGLGCPWTGLLVGVVDRLTSSSILSRMVLERERLERLEREREHDQTILPFPRVMRP